MKGRFFLPEGPHATPPRNTLHGGEQEIDLFEELVGVLDGDIEGTSNALVGGP